MENESKIILVCGGSCSGKTTLAESLKNSIRCMGTGTVISMDDYYYDLSGWDPVEADKKNFDCPEAIDSGLLFQRLRDLKIHGKIRERRYDFKTHYVTEPGSYLETADFIILEGIFALYFEELRRLASAGIFIHADADIRLARRVERDVAERHLPVELVLRQYLNDVRPMHEKYVEPSSKYADLLLDSNFCSPLENQRKAMDFLKESLAAYEKK